MEKHKCKLCFRVFPTGRSLGGHMKSHFATFPPHPPKSSAATTRRQQQQLAEDDSVTESSSSSFLSAELEVQQTVKSSGRGEAVAYELQGNQRQRKRFRGADPDSSFAGGFSSAVVQDRESETESVVAANPIRRRSKRARRPRNRGVKKGSLVGNGSMVFDSPAAAEQDPVSSVSDTSPDEDVAMCLIMLSRDVNWKTRDQRFSNDDDEIEEEDFTIGGETEKKEDEEEIDEEISERRVRVGKKMLKCEKCAKSFRSSPALGSHRRICSLNEPQLRDLTAGETEGRIFRCPYCSKVFGSGQALGGHKRSHLTNMGSYPPPLAASKTEKSCNLLDLNFPPPPAEDDEFSVVSDG